MDAEAILFEAQEREFEEFDARMTAEANEQLVAEREKALQSALRECALMGVSLESLRTLAFETGSRYNPANEPVWSNYETEWQLWS